MISREGGKEHKRDFVLFASFAPVREILSALTGIIGIF